MSFSISLPKRGGAALSKSSGNQVSRRFVAVFRISMALLSPALIFTGAPAISARAEPTPAAITRAAANRCDSKVKALEANAARKEARPLTTEFSEDEINSYFALILSPKFNPCLKRVSFKFEENRLQAVADIDFDRLGKSSSKLFSRLLSLMLSGVHALTVRGQLVSGNGKASFRLEQARFDNTTLPKALVEEIITAVGRRQKPPFDPMKPSELFYGIQKVDVHAGYLVAHQ